mgnify:CR=1 FL=1
MTLTEEQRETVEGIKPKGFHIDSGEPCECGAEQYQTTKSRGYSDYMTYTHKCSECGNQFSTYIEG